MSSLVRGYEAKVISKRKSGNGLSLDVDSQLWILLDGFDDGIEDPNEDDWREWVTLKNTSSKLEPL